MMGRLRIEPVALSCMGEGGLTEEAVLEGSLEG